ncbi:MAG: hypothetical protein JWN07_1649 [Hyphomicrobiales bacterium]|nr:hypothetical protein [Hyphomicrobiales bacterium]
MASRVIVLEFNELTPALMDRFIAAGHLPNFARLRSESIVAITDAEEDPPALEPWIQWVTVHTGLSFAEHGVYDLGDGEEFRAPRIWDIVADQGERVLVCGSMNAAIQTTRSDLINLVPDPWAVNLRPQPAELYDDFYHFVRTYVQEYTSERPPLTKSDYAKTAAFLLRHGLSLKTVMDAVTQLASETTGMPKWRRAVILDRLLWDVFRSEWKRLQPAFSTIFLNSTAHFQHYYWREMDPSAFELKSASESKASDAILFGYKRMDRIVGECIDMAGPDTTIVLCTALGQQPLTHYDQTGGKQVYKVRDATVLLRYAGFQGNFQFAPVMAEQFHLFFDSEEEAATAEDKLRKLTLNGEAVMDMRRDGKQIFAGCGIIREPGETAVIVTPHSNKPVPFHTLFYPVDTIKSGGHHPDGIFWIRRPDHAHVSVQRKISLREIAPTLLTIAGITTKQTFAFPPMPEIADADAAKSQRLSA